MTLFITLVAFVFIIGLCIGSFLNVVILRTLSEESIVFPASKCPKCQHPLKWWHNIPLISYICLKGKCAFCKEPISIQYPIVELLTGIIFTLIFLKFGISVDTIVGWIISSLLIVIAGTDFKEKVVYDIHTLSLVGVGLLYAAIVTAYGLFVMHNATGEITFSKDLLLNNPFTNSVLGIIAGIVIMELFARFGYLVQRGVRMFEVGDTYIAAGLGAFLGWRTLILALILSVILQVIYFLPLFIKDLFCKREWKTLIPFVLFVIYAIAFFSLEHYGIIDISNFALYIALTLLLAGLGIYTCYRIFKGLRENPSSATCLPFGPARVGAALILFIL